MTQRSVRWPSLSEVPSTQDTWRRYDLLRTDAADFSAQTDVEGNIIWASADLLNLTGHLADSVLGQPIEFLVATRDADRVTDSRAVIDEGATFDETMVHLIAADGDEVPVALRTQPIHDNEREVVGYMKSFIDVAEHSAVLRALVTLSRCMSVLLRASDEQSMLNDLCAGVIASGSYTLCWYGRAIHDEERTVQIVAQAGTQKDYVANLNVHWDDSPRGNGPSGTSIKTQTTQVRNDVLEAHDFEPWRQAARDFNLRASISIPVFINDELDGSFVVYASEVGAFDALARGLFEDLAADLGYTLERFRTQR